VIPSGCGSGNPGPAAGLRIYDPSEHMAGEVGPTDVVRSSVRTSPDQPGTAVLFFQLTSRGKQRIHTLTRALARRGARLHRNQHFAFAVSGHVYARPFIDYRALPNGIDGEPGIEISGIPRKVAQRIAAEMRDGAAG
jgi:hypothetical protein